MSDAPDPAVLLAWMRGHGPGVIPARSIGDTGPRAFRRRADSEAVLAALLDAGEIVEVSARPRAFRVVEVEAAISPEAGIPAAAGAGDVGDRDGLDAVPNSEIRALFQDALARHVDQGLSPAAAGYLASRDTFDALRTDPRLAPVQRVLSECNICGSANDGTFLRVGGRVSVHARCLGEHRAAIAAHVDVLIVAALDSPAVPAAKSAQTIVLGAVVPLGYNTPNQ